MADLKEVVMFIIGVFGLLGLPSKTTSWQLGLLTVNLVHKVYLCGNRFNSLQQNKVAHIHQQNCYHMKGITPNSIRSENTWRHTQNNQKALNWKHIKADWSKRMQLKLQSRPKEHQRTIRVWEHCTGSWMTHGLQFHGQQSIFLADGNLYNTKQNNCMKM